MSHIVRRNIIGLEERGPRGALARRKHQNNACRASNETVGDWTNFMQGPKSAESDFPSNFVERGRRQDVTGAPRRNEGPPVGIPHPVEKGDEEQSKTRVGVVRYTDR